MSFLIDWTTLGNDINYIDLGNIRIAFGLHNQGWNAGTGTSSNISYGVTFKESPKVFCTFYGYNGIEMVSTASKPGVENFKIVYNNTFGQTLSANLAWLAIGLKPE